MSDASTTMTGSAMALLPASPTPDSRVAEPPLYSCGTADTVEPTNARDKAPADDELATENRALITLTVIDSAEPNVLSKSFSLNADGGLEPKSGGQLAHGIARKTKLPDANAIADLLLDLAPHQALMHGVFAHDLATVLSKKRRHAIRHKKIHPPVVCRVKEETAWPAGPGILMLDYDPPADKSPFTAGTLRAEIYAAVPELKDAPHICRPSASSCVYRESDGAELRGQHGQRIYVLVKDARDIERAARVLAGRLWLAGQGFYTVSKSGFLLERTLFDLSVFQPSRLDFAGGAKCGSGLVQRLPAPVVFNNDATLLDTERALPNPTGEENRKIEVLKSDARAAKASDVIAAKERWIEQHVSQFEAALNESDQVKRAEKITAYEKSCRAALNDNRLFGDFVITLDDGAAVTVGEILDNPDKYHGLLCLDPLEPDYDNSRAVGKIFLRGGRPVLFSFARGNRTFRLVRARRAITLATGERADVFAKVAELLRLDGDLFVRGGMLVRILGNQIVPITADWLTLHLDRNVRFETMKKQKDGASVPVPQDAPIWLAKFLIAAANEYGLPELGAVIDAPTMDVKTGRIIAEPGYDAASKLFLNLPPDIGGINENVTANDARREFKFLWNAFKDFPFCDASEVTNGAVSRGVHLATLLTATVRPMLLTAPATLYDAPTAGSGKTLLARCAAKFRSPASPAALGMPKNVSEEEASKILVSEALCGSSVMLMDNISGSFESAALCAYITSDTYKARVLGTNTTPELPTNSLVLMTGNHPIIGGDLNRRILRCGLDAQMESPFKRAFALDPLEFCHENRMELVRACLTILMAWHNAGRPNVTPDRTGSFDLWSDTIRQATIWCGSQGWLDVADPCLSFDAGFEADPDTNKLGNLLRAWDCEFGSARQALKELRDYAAHGGSDLFDALDEIGVVGPNGKLNTRQLGWWVKQHAGRIVDGRRFLKGTLRNGISTWYIESTHPPNRRSGGGE